MSTIFHSERLTVRILAVEDKDLFYEMMSDPKVMDPIPQSVFSREDSDAKILELIKSKPVGEKMIWTITEKGANDLIGICGFLINSEGNRELAYRFRPQFWGKGYGTEVAKELLNYGFNTLNYKVIDADANKDNAKSIKILDKFMTKVNEFWNENDKCYDYRFRLKKG
ncbi:MAG: GNAT family N-acetyltransferase [Crocinitomicaceae bacterium]